MGTLLENHKMYRKGYQTGYHEGWLEAKAKLKADMITMLEELQADIEEMSGLCMEIHGSEWAMKNVIDTQEVLILLKQKINKLKGAEDGKIDRYRRSKKRI